MHLLQDPVRKFVAQKIASALANELSLADIYTQLVEPPQPEMGDLAFGCFQLSKVKRKSPAQIATELQNQITISPEEGQVLAAGPYVNFTLTPSFLGRVVLDAVIQGAAFQAKLTENTPRTMVEYSQPNTHKEIHVGHMRNACLGDALIRLLRYCNYDVISTTFPGDVGTHVAKCLWYMKFHNNEPVPTTHKGEWLGKLYSRAHLKLEDETGTPQEEKNREQLTEILKQLEAKQGEFYELWKETRQWSIDLMNAVYDWAGIHFDKWYWESDVDSDSVKYIKELYTQGKLQKSEGAVGMNLEAEGLGFCLLLKSDGTGLYATKDVELARRKFKEQKIEKSIYVVDMRQALHFKQVFKVLEKLGFEEAKNCFHLQYNFVELPDGAMSSRKGNIVPLTDLVKKMEQTVIDNYLHRYRGEWPEEEIHLVASQVAQGAIKYGMLRMDTNKKIVFDMTEWLKIEGESGPFVQYSVARINSLYKKFAGGQDMANADWTLLNHPSEKLVMKSLIHFNHLVLQSAENYRPSQLCTYLYELAKRFNLFYHECSIGMAETEALKMARLSLAFAVGKTLQKGLSLLGIPSPQRM